MTQPSTERRRWSTRCSLALAAFAAASFAGGCGSRPPAPKTPEELELAARTTYLRLQESLDGIDLSVLQGRRIVIDPGHGGGYRGATFRGGLSEADVNLGVSLYLWGLLREAGAQATLTRSTDRDFVGTELKPPDVLPLPGEPVTIEERASGPPADSLVSDLAARTALANELQPDLFISIHHNAAADGDSTGNESQTYFRMGDPGPSQDAAQAIHRHLMLNLGSARGRVLPGNYYVLRHSTARAAVLGEASFITNPVLAGKLRQIDRVELEATAYFLGIVDYFRSGVARVVAIAPADTTLADEAVNVFVGFGGDAIDPASVRLWIDGVLAPVRAVDVALAIPPDGPPQLGEVSELYATRLSGPPAPGTHSIRVAARCLEGNAVPPRAARFSIHRPAAGLVARQRPLWNGEHAIGPLALEVRVHDRFGLPVADSTHVALDAPVRASGFTRDGVVWFYVDPTPLPAAGRHWRISADGVTREVPMTTPGAPAARSGWVRDPHGRGIRGALVYSRSGTPLAITNADGFFAMPLDSSVAAVAPGYEAGDWVALDTSQVILEPRFNGALHGIRIAVDAAGGGDDALDLTGLGVRGSELTLALAEQVAQLLREAGADVLMVRDTDTTLPDLFRVEASETFGSDGYLRLGVTLGGTRVRHYPGSTLGRALAQHLASALTAINDGAAGSSAGSELAEAARAATAGAPQVESAVTPVLQQTSCPAVEVLFRLPPWSDFTRGIGAPSMRRSLARAIVDGLVEATRAASH